MNKPQNYDELYPGRFLKAALFKGKQVTLTIADIFTEGLAAEEEEDKSGESEPPAVILAFRETKKQLVIPKTNAFCLMSMFGKRLADWVDKKVVFFPSTTRMMGKTIDCIRIWGSPHISSDMPLSIPQGLRKPLKMTMHAMKTNPGPGETRGPASETKSPIQETKAPSSETLPDPDKAVLEAWSFLGWSREQGHKDMAEFKGENYLDHLSALVDKQEEGVA